MATSLIPRTVPLAYGNEPGDGPLRPGGQAGIGTVHADEDKPDSMSSAARRQQKALQMVRDLAVGSERVRALTPAASGTWRLLLTDPRRTELPVARNRARGLKRVLGL